MELASGLITPGALFLLTLFSGFWLRSFGRPLNGLVFNIHKLIALAAVIIATVQIYNRLANTQIPLPLFGLMICIGLCVITLFGTGAFMSIRKDANDIPRIIHNVALVLLVFTMAGTFYLLAGRKL